MKILDSAGLKTALTKIQKELNKKQDGDSEFKRCRVLTQSQYDSLSSTEKNRADTLYFIKK